jgi:uncharacterized protein YvpB
MGKRIHFIKSFLTFFIILSVLGFAFFIDNSSSWQMAQGVQTIKHWIKSPVVNTNTFLEDKFHMSIIKLKDKVLIDAPAINQFPELPRGCEVTSLAMLLQHAGVYVDKNTLAEEIRKDATPYKVADGKIYFGNPHDGFVGDMYSFDNPGLGVYHEPIKDLAEKYLPGQIKDLTGSSFQELRIHLSDDRPVWVVTNTAYKKLPRESFQTWDTPSGKVDITYKEHSVLLTGYDDNYIYFNDPLTGEKNKKASLKDFEEAWEEMGSQAITYHKN